MNKLAITLSEDTMDFETWESLPKDSSEMVELEILREQMGKNEERNRAELKKRKPVNILRLSFLIIKVI